MRLILMSTLLLALSALGCEKSKPITMQLLPAAEDGPEATAAKGPHGEPAIELVAGAAGDTLALAVCDDPALSEQDHIVRDQLIQYIVRGQVKYDGAAGDGHLELLSEFTGKKNVVTTYNDRLELDGFSDWGSFEIGPRSQSGMLLTRLTLNVVLPAGGTAAVAEPLVVIPRNPSTAWCTAMHIVWIGLGLCAIIAILGCSAFLLAAWGRSRRLAVSLLVTSLAISAVSLFAGIVALCASQPWPIYFQLLLQGGIGLFVWGINVPNILRYFRANELRRMTAADVV